MDLKERHAKDFAEHIIKDGLLDESLGNIGTKTDDTNSTITNKSIAFESIEIFELFIFFLLKKREQTK